MKKHGLTHGIACHLVALVAVCLCAVGCRTPERSALSLAEASKAAEASARLRPGDVVQVTFPGAPTLNMSQRVELNGVIRLPLVGEVVAAGKTPLELQAAVAKLYEGHLQMNEVLVILVSSSASIYVAGAVGRPGRINMERPMTVLDAIMEAGGFDPKRANVKKVAVIRQEKGRYSRHPMDLRPVLRGENVAPFELRPFDTVFVPEKIF